VNLVPNGDMELMTPDWESINSPTTNERSDTRAYNGTYSRHIVCDAAGSAEQGSRMNATGLVIGVSYTLTGYIWLVSGTYAYIHCLAGGSPAITSTTGSWVEVTDTFTANATTGYVNILATKNAEVYFDYLTLLRA